MPPFFANLYAIHDMRILLSMARKSSSAAAIMANRPNTLRQAQGQRQPQGQREPDAVEKRRQQLVARFNARSKAAPPLPVAIQIENPAFVNEAATEAAAIEPYDPNRFSQFLFSRCGFEAEQGQRVQYQQVNGWWDGMKNIRSKIQLEQLSMKIHADEESNPSNPWRIT
jgi:hypothetical protein